MLNRHLFQQKHEWKVQEYQINVGIWPKPEWPKWRRELAFEFATDLIFSE